MKCLVVSRLEFCGAVSVKHLESHTVQVICIFSSLSSSDGFMHDTAYEIGAKFIATYQGEQSTVLEIGSCDVNGSLRDACAKSTTYIGVDVAHGKGVDIVTRPGEPIPIRSEFCDILISSSQMEHDPKFWKTFLEFCRLTKKGGFIYLNIPSNGNFHQYPLDIWRFYPDAAFALRDWANEAGYRLIIIESFTAKRKQDIWNDFVAIFHVGEWPKDRSMEFISDSFECYNIQKYGIEGVTNHQQLTEDQLLLWQKDQIIQQKDEEIARLTAEINRHKGHSAAPGRGRTRKVRSSSSSG